MSHVILLHNVGELKYFSWKCPSWPLCPYKTFEVILLITFVATHPLVILTKFGQNMIKYMEEETNCEKEKEEEIARKE